MVFNPSLLQGKYPIIGLQLAFFKIAIVTLEIRNSIIIIILLIIITKELKASSG